MVVLAFVAIAVLLVLLFRIVGMLIDSPGKEQSLSELELEVVALDAEYALALQGKGSIEPSQEAELLPAHALQVDTLR